MGTFDIFNRDKEEEYKGVKLSPDVDAGLQKQLIDRGRSNEIQGLKPTDNSSFVKELGRSAVDFGKSYVNEAMIPAVKIINNKAIEPVANVVNEKAVLPATEWLNKTDDISTGAVKRDDGQAMLVEDLPMAQQVAGSVFHVSKNIGTGILGTAESTLRGFEWLGADSAKPLADKLTDWQKSVAVENPTFADKLASGIGSAITFFAPGVGVMKGATAIGMLSPRLAMLFGNSAMTAFEALTEAGDSYQQAMTDGKGKKQASDTASKVFWANAVLIGLTNQLGYFNKIEGLKKLLVSSPMEGLQEFGQQVIQNVTSGRPWDQGAYEAGAIGTILGGILGGHEIGMEAIKEPVIEKQNNKTTSQISIPDKFYQVETKDGTKYFETKPEAENYANSNVAAGTFLITEKNSEDALDVIKNNNVSAFPFETGKSASQIKIDDAIVEIKKNSGLTADQSAQAFTLIKNMVESEKTAKDYPEIFNDAVEMAKADNGEVPDIVQQAIKQAQKEVAVPVDKMVEPQPEAVYHQTNENADNIKDRGFQMGKNSVFGEAAFFGEKADKTYGDNQVSVKPADFNLKTIKTVDEQKKFVASQKAKNLSDAIRSEGKYDGFIIPNKELGNVYGVTNKEKLDQKLKEQQFVTSDEARAMSKNFKFIEELNLPLMTKEKILTPAGQEAFGKYYKGVISFIENPHKTTIPHEAVHAYLDLMLSKKQKQNVIEEVKRRYAGKKFTDIQAEEQLADDFVKYYTAKFDNPATAKAPSNKLKQFFDWFIEQLNKLVGKGDIIEGLYKDILNKKPGIIQKQIIRQRIQRGLSQLDDLQKEYFQNPDALTIKFLENVDVKNREFSSYQFLKDLAKSKGLPLKESERNLINDILDTQFKDEKKIAMEDFRNAVRSELMPLQVIETETYSEYGADNVGLSDTEQVTHIYNSPFNHGYTGHFSGDFDLKIKISDLEIKQIPGHEKFAVMKKGVELNEANIAENVYHLANTKKAAQSWIDSKILNDETVSYKNSSIDVGLVGLFGHTRIWDPIDTRASSDTVGGTRYVAEIQSDAFQNLERITDRSEKFFENYKTVAEAEKAFKDKPVFIINKDEDSDYQVENISEIQSAFDSGWNVAFEKTKPMTPEEVKFMQFKNVWHERIIREEIRRAAMDGKHKLRFPTPHTIAKIEGYLSGDGQIPEDTVVGETFDYSGNDYILLSDDYGESGKAVPEENLRGIYDFSQVREDEINSVADDLVYEIKHSKNLNEINNSTSVDFSKEEIAALKKAVKEDDQDTIAELAQSAAEKSVDSQYHDAESFVYYYAENIENNFAFAAPNNQVIFLNNNGNIETLGFGTTEIDKDGFDYEEDLGIQEQRTVARFYDKQVGRYLAKLRKQNFREITDENGYDWYETDIMPEDKSAVEAFQTKPAEKPTHRTGKEVANYVDEIEIDKDEDANRIDAYIRDVIEGQDFELKTIELEQLLREDKDLAEYVKTGTNRYARGEGTDANLPIVIGYWEPKTAEDFGVIDGFNRVLTKVKRNAKYIEAFVATPNHSDLTSEQLFSRLKFGYMGGKEELRAWGMPAIGATHGMADIGMIDGKAAIALSWSEGALAGFSVHPDFQRRGLGQKFVSHLAAENGQLKVYDPNEKMTAMLEKIGAVSEPDGRGVVTFTLNEQPKFQIKDDMERYKLEMRRGEYMDRIERESYEKEAEILAARELDLAFEDSQKEDGYQHFKELVRYRKWILEPQSDEANLKFRIRDKNLDDYLFSGASDVTNDNLLMMFKDRYEQEQNIKALASQRTPSEIAEFEKRTAELIVKKETLGRKPTMKNAINAAIGVDKPLKITMKETTLLAKKIRDMARGIKMGRADMRDTLIEAFRTKQENIAEIKKAIISYASDLSTNEKGKLLPMVAGAKSQKDLAKAMMRIDAAVQRVDKNEQLQAVKEAAAEIGLAVRTGKGIAVDYQKQLIDILKDYDLKKPTAKTLARLQSLKQYLDNNPGFMPDYVVNQLDRLSKKNAGQMTVEEIKELNDTLNKMIALGHLKLQLKNNYDERVRQISVAKLLTSTNSLDPKGDPKEASYNRKEAKTNMYLHTLHSFRVTDQIDGYLDYKGQNTRLQRQISSKVNNAELSADAILKSVFDEIKAIQDGWTEKEQAIMEFHLLIQQGAHNQANELATIQGWKEIPELTQEMATAMDLMRGAFQKTEDYLAAVYEELNNKPFEKVENYFPLKYEQRKGEIPEPTIGQKFLRSAKTEQGFTMKRLPNVKRTPRIDVFAQFEEAIREQQYFMQVQPTLLEVRSIVNDDAYKAKAGRIVTNWWRDYIDAMSNHGQLSGVRSNAYLRYKRIQLSRAILGYKVSSILLQPMAIFDAVAYTQLRFGQIAAGRLLLHFSATWINPFYARRVKRLSPSVQLRQGTAGELAIEEITTSAKRKKISEKFNRGSMTMLRWADIKTAASVDQAIYKILRGQNLSESDARAEADLIMNIVSGSSEVADRPMVLMSGEGMRTLFTFQTFMLNRWGLIAHDIVKSGLIHGTLGRKAKSIYALFILALAGGVENELRLKIYQLISGGEVKQQLSFWKGAFLSIPEAIPIIGQIIQGYAQAGQSFSIPMTRVIENFRLGSQQIFSSDPEKQVKGFLRLGEAVATWNGIAGASQAEDILERLIINNKPKTKTQLEIALPILPEILVPDITLPSLPALPAL